MNEWDFSVYWAAGLAILKGGDPYAVPNFFYPLPFAYFLTIFALLPEHVSFAIWLFVNLILLVVIFRKQFWQWLLYAPVLHMFSSGQVELLWWSLARGLGRHWQGAILGALITIKPQAALILLPWHLLDWLRHDRRTFFRWAGLTALIWTVPMLWRPRWIFDWLAALPQDSYKTASNTAGIFSLLKFSPTFLIPALIIAIPLFIWGQTRNEAISRASIVIASPVGLFYSTMTLIDCAPAWLLVPVSIASVVLTLLVNSFTPFILLPIAVISWQLYDAAKQTKPQTILPEPGEIN